MAGNAENNIGIPGTGRVLDALWHNRSNRVRALALAAVVAVGFSATDSAVDAYGSVPIYVAGFGTDVSAGISFGDTTVVERRLSAGGQPLAIHLGDAEIGITLGRRDTGFGLDLPKESNLPVDEVSLVTTGESVTVFTPQSS